jgi:hypothetical protein
MRKTVVSKTMMMIAGILAAFLIVLSQSFYPEGEKKAEKNKTEQQSEKQTEVSISVPDAVAQTNIIQLDDQVPVVLHEELSSERKHPALTILRPAVAARYFKILFRAFICTNAP